MRILIIGLALFTVFSASAQMGSNRQTPTGTICGKVIDSASGKA